MLGEHAHVVQPITKVNGKWVVYGMGNMVAQQEVDPAGDLRGILVRFTFVERRGRPFAVTAGGVRPGRLEQVLRRRVVPDPGPPPGRPGDRAARAAVVAAVDGLGRTPGLRAE